MKRYQTLAITLFAIALALSACRFVPLPRPPIQPDGTPIAAVG